MVNVGLWVRLRAKDGKENELARFLAGALPAAQAEPLTRVWFALRISHSEYAIFDAFDGPEGREAHLAGPIAAALLGRADELLAGPPRIEPVDVLAAKA